MTTKQRLHELVDRLPEGETGLAERLLEDLLEDPVAVALRNAPLDDEPETEEERAAVEEAKAAYRRGEYLTDEDVARALKR
ncbi:MAG: hypothetical protein EXR51_06895 [Dehalococcoidia bacterium]|nr:hypothetical protein [Dehalococcoidia bacterium]